MNDATLTVGGVTKTRGRFNRYGKEASEAALPQPAGYRSPKGEVENPHGQWNVLELYADGDKVKYIVNGKVPNEGAGAKPSRGRILFQSEGAEVFFRNIELRVK